ncbi:MAG: 5-bromo-4-chloroindolyl phosphate hydrolysis family protein [Thiohalocapsa sp.]
MKRLLLLAVVVLIAATLLTLLWRRLPKGLFGFGGGTQRASPAPGLLLFLLPLPVVAAAAVSLAQGQLIPLLGNVIAYGLFLGGALLVRRGLLSARGLIPERMPVKTFGSVLISLATGTTAWLGAGHHPAIAIAFALIALLGCYLTYGFDLRTRHSALDGQGIGADARMTLARADQSIAAIEQASRDIRQPELNSRLRRIAELAREILNRLEEDPRDLRRTRKFLNVYLDGVQTVVEGYANTHDRVSAPELDERFRHALVTIEDVFQEQQQKLLESDVDNLDLQIEVLTQQLKREGIL